MSQGAPQSDVPVVDTAEQVYISSLALLKVRYVYFIKQKTVWSKPRYLGFF